MEPVEDESKELTKSTAGTIGAKGDEGRDISPELTPFKKKVICTLLAILVVLVSFFPVANWASSVETHASTIATLDEKQSNVMALSALAASASVAISVLPDDVGNSIADQLAELSSDFAVIVAAIVLEKYLLTVVGLVAFKGLVPAACLLFLLSVWNCSWARGLQTAAFKLALFGILLFSVVPASAFLANCIDETYDVSASAVVSDVEESVDSEDAAQEEAPNSEGEEGGFLSSLKNTIVDKASDMADAVTNVSTAAISKATSCLNNLLEAFAVMVVTSCVLPILVLLLALWLMNLLLGLNVSAPVSMLKSKPWRASAKEVRRKGAAAAKDFFEGKDVC